MRDLPQTRQSLILRLQDRSGDGWTEFLAIYEQAIYGYCRRRGLQDADALDVTQEVLTAVGERVGGWDDDPSKGRFRGWLFRVARNIAVDRFVERSRRVAVAGDPNVARMLEELPDDDEARSAGFWIEYRRRLMHWAAAKVRPDVQERSWRSFWMTAVEGRSPDEVARSLGTTVGGVYTAKCRVFARIRALVSRLDDDPMAGSESLRESLQGVPIP